MTTDSGASVDPRSDWVDDCMAFWGRVLTGKRAHWCEEWDYLPIDETCDEFECCRCQWEGDQ